MKNNYCDIDRNISYICHNEYKYFLNKCNVIGIGLGYKIKNHFYTCIKCIKVFVVTKVGLNNLSIRDIVPNMYKGIPTDVVESGYIYMNSLDKRVRPTICGYSIGPIGFLDSSTLGCVVKNQKERYILGSTHGIVHNISPIGGKVLQPAVLDGGKFPQDQIGFLEKYIPLKPRTIYEEPENIIDACIIRVENNKNVSDEIYGIGKLKGTEVGKLNQPVVKVGSTTALTTGKITALDVSIEVKANDKKYLYADQISTTSMSDLGDSGGMLIGNGNKAIGVLCASGKNITLYNKIDNVLKILNVQIDTN